MEFSGQYLTYAEYKALGGTLDQTPFNLLEFEARKQIDLRTQKRLVSLTEIPNEVKLCDFHLINKLEKYAESMNSVGGNIASESTDGYSISYVTANQLQSVIEAKNMELSDIITTDLFGLIVNGEHAIYIGMK